MSYQGEEGMDSDMEMRRTGIWLLWKSRNAFVEYDAESLVKKAQEDAEE